MITRLRRPASVVLDGRILSGARAKAWRPAAPYPTVFEFAHACGTAGALVAADGRRRSVRLVAVLYRGGRIFAAPGEGPARFGILLHARGRATPGKYDLDVPGKLPYLRGVPVSAVPSAHVRALGGNLLFLVG